MYSQPSSIQLSFQGAAFLAWPHSSIPHPQHLQLVCVHHDHGLADKTLDELQREG